MSGRTEGGVKECKHCLEIMDCSFGCKADTYPYPRYIAASNEDIAMTGTVNADAASLEGGLEARRKKLKFRSWHRGTREMDLILGPFADRAVDALTGEELDQYERLLDIPDTEFFEFVTGNSPVPQALDCPLLQRILASGRTARS